LFIGGDHVPVTALVDAVGKSAKVAPEQIGATCENAGVTFGLTIMFMVTVFAHNPIVGVNVYIVVAELFIGGDHVPVTALVDVVAKFDKFAPEQIGATCENVGVTIGLTVMVIVLVVAH
jgi:hypothetical protein